MGHCAAFANNKHIRIVKYDCPIGYLGVGYQPGNRHRLEGVAVEIIVGKAIAGAFGERASAALMIESRAVPTASSKAALLPSPHRLSDRHSPPELREPCRT